MTDVILPEAHYGEVAVGSEAAIIADSVEASQFSEAAENVITEETSSYCPVQQSASAVVHQDPTLPQSFCVALLSR